MRFVPIKSDDQLDLQSLHRVRERWVMRRTAVINQIRGLLLVDLHLQVIELQLQLQQKHAQCAGELGAGVFQDPGQCRHRYGVAPGAQ
jgi:hypothetical protein